MRRIGTARPARWDEQGLALSMVALSLVAIIGVAALVVDIGNGYRTRRALIPATDAAALAAAQTYMAGGTGCPATATSYLTANESTATMTACTRTGSGASQGRVIVTASDNVDTWFAPVIGKGDYTVSSTSTAQWGPPSAVSGLRPLGLCAFGDATLEGLVTNPKAFGSTPVTLHISYDKDQAKDCGTNVPGNWGMINFDGKSGNTSAQSTIIKDGFPGLVNIGNDQTGSSKSCPSSEIHCYPGDTGALAGLDAAFTTLKTSGIWFTIPVFDFAVGNGANAKFHLMGVLRVQLVDFDTNGSQSGSSSSSSSKSSGKKDDDDDDDDDDDGPFFEFKVQPGLITGTCCGPASGTGNNRVLALCAVDPKSSGSCSA